MDENTERINWWVLPLVIPVLIWKVLTRRTYYITGTGTMKGTGDRKWFKVVFVTSGMVVPIKSLEDMISEEIGMEGAVIVFFHRIPNRMRRYMKEDYSLRIEMVPDEKSSPAGENPTPVETV